LFLDPRFSWHAGFKWWDKKMLGVIKELKESRDVSSLAEARWLLANELASIELFPYHSKKFGSDNLLNKLKSTEMAVKFVNDYVYQKAKHRKAIVIVARRPKIWSRRLKKVPGRVMLYKRKHARGAYLTNESRKAILVHLRHLIKTRKR
jgi:hypothetical protein